MMESSGAWDPAPLATALRRVSKILLKAHPRFKTMLDKAEFEATVNVPDWKGGGSQDIILDETVGFALSACDTLKFLRRSLEGAVEEVEALEEDALVQVTLRQYEKSLDDRHKVESHLAGEQRAVEDLRKEVNLQEHSLRKEQDRQRVEETSGVERLKALERRVATSEVSQADLQHEIDAASRILTESIAKNHGLDDSLKKLQKEHVDALEENSLAEDYIAPWSNVERFRKKNANERAEQDASLIRLREETEAQIAKLEREWAQQQEKYNADLAELQGQVRGLQAFFDEKRQTAESTLDRQGAERGREVEMAKQRVAAEIRSFEEQRQQKSLALRHQAAHARQRLQETTTGTTRHLEIQRNELRHIFHERLQQEEAKCEEEILQERKAVADASVEAQRSKKKSDRLRENYKSHAMKSGHYVRTLEAKRKAHIQALYVD